MAVAERVLAEHQADFEEARKEYQAWFDYNKAVLEASMRELELESEGSSPDVSDYDRSCRAIETTSRAESLPPPPAPFCIRLTSRRPAAAAPASRRTSECGEVLGTFSPSLDVSYVRLYVLY